MAFRVFGLDAAYRLGDRFAFGFLRLGIVMVDGVLLVDGSAVSRDPFGPQG